MKGVHVVGGGRAVGLVVRERGKGGWEVDGRDTINLVTAFSFSKERFSTGVFMANWDFGTKWTVKPLVVL
jgi:hypothetical protein